MDNLELEINRMKEIKLVSLGRFNDYFTRGMDFALILKDIVDKIAEGEFESLSIDYLKEINLKLYDDILKDNYEKSYANPKYAVEMFGESIGRLLSFVYVNMREKIESAFSLDIDSIVRAVNLFNRVFEILRKDVGDADGIKKEIIKSEYENIGDKCEGIYKKLIGDDNGYLEEIVRKSNLKDLKYLYKYDSYIGERELEIVRFLNQVSYEEINSMADTYVEAFKRSFDTCNADINKKGFVLIYYVIGFERIIRRAAEKLENEGFKAVYILDQPYYTNKQYKYDHRYDYGIYLDEDYMKAYLKGIESACLKFEKELNRIRGLAIITTFGDEEFFPKRKSESLNLSAGQREVYAELNSKKSIIQSEYFNFEDTGYTMISYPIPEVGEKFREIFQETIKINNLDISLYTEIQQRMIDILDQGDYVHILGRDKNKTDLIVKLQELRNPEKNTLFSNCRADLNVPIGEVYTSPKLKGTSGKLHVTEVFLDGLNYKDLELDIKDGMVIDYLCKNFNDINENKGVIKENILNNYSSLPIGEFAIGTNTRAYVMGKKYKINNKLPILIAEKTGPHFAVGDTCYAKREDMRIFNPDKKEICAKENECSILRKSTTSRVYFNCHKDITIPYDEIKEIAVYRINGHKDIIISNGRFVLEGTEELNRPFREIYLNER